MTMDYSTSEADDDADLEDGNSMLSHPKRSLLSQPINHSRFRRQSRLNSESSKRGNRSEAAAVVMSPLPHFPHSPVEVIEEEASRWRTSEEPPTRKQSEAVRADKAHSTDQPNSTTALPNSTADLPNSTAEEPRRLSGMETLRARLALEFPPELLDAAASTMFANVALDSIPFIDSSGASRPNSLHRTSTVGSPPLPAVLLQAASARPHPQPPDHPPARPNSPLPALHALSTNTHLSPQGHKPHQACPHIPGARQISCYVSSLETSSGTSSSRLGPTPMSNSQLDSVVTAGEEATTSTTDHRLIYTPQRRRGERTPPPSLRRRLLELLETRNHSHPAESRQRRLRIAHSIRAATTSVKKHLGAAFPFLDSTGADADAAKSRSLAKKEHRHIRRERKATQTLAVVLIVFLVCWVPFFTCHMANSLCILLREGKECVDFVAFFFTTWLGYMNSFMNPIIYTIFNPEYRKAFRRIILCASH